MGTRNHPERLHGIDRGALLGGVAPAVDCLGRSKEAMQHVIACGKLPTVRSDRGDFLDREDLDPWIERSKIQHSQACSPA